MARTSSTLKFTDPYSFGQNGKHEAGGPAAAVETPAYQTERCFPQTDCDLKINAGPEPAPF